MKVNKGTIAILGSGAWGTSLACTLNRKGKIVLWSHEKVTIDEINKFRTYKVFLPKVKIPKNVFLVAKDIHLHLLLLKGQLQQLKFQHFVLLL